MLTEKQIDIILEVFKPYNPKKIGIFGSVARNEDTTNSDIDILYQFYTPISLFDKACIQNDLEKRLKKKVDLVAEKFMHPRFKDYILADLNVIYEH